MAVPVRGVERLVVAVMLLVWCIALPSARATRAQEMPPDPPPAQQDMAEAPATNGAPPDTAPAAPSSPIVLVASTPTPLPSTAAAPAAGCSGAYGLYADSSGRYLATGCPAPGAGSGLGGSAPLGGSTAPPCLLYPSSSQPTLSSQAGPGVGAPLAAAASVAPACSTTSLGRASSGSPGVPACQLYPSANQPTTRTFGTANYPVTPLPAPAQTTPPGGTIAGFGC